MASITLGIPKPRVWGAGLLAVTLGATVVGCSREESGAQPTTPAEEPEWDVLDSGADTSPLGFSAVEAAAMFEGSYEAELRYNDGSTTTLTIDVEPSGADLHALDSYLYPPGVKYAYGTASARGPLQRSGIKEGPSLNFAVDVGFHSEDGQFAENLPAVLRVMSDEFARLEPGVAQEDFKGAHELEGTFEVEGSEYALLLTDLFRSDDGPQTSGWVGYLDDSNPPARVVLATWNVCQVRFLDGGTQCLGVERLP